MHLTFVIIGWAAVYLLVCISIAKTLFSRKHAIEMWAVTVAGAIVVHLMQVWQ